MTNRFIVFLRGVNVSGSNKIKMADLKTELINHSDIDNVITYIQSGNLLIESKLDASTVNQLIEKTISNAFHLSVPAVTLNKKKFQSILENNPYSERETANQYFILLFNEPKIDLYKSIDKDKHPNEEFSKNGNTIYLYVHKGYGKAKLNNTIFERKLKVSATARNYNTMMKMYSLLNS